TTWAPTVSTKPALAQAPARANQREPAAGVTAAAPAPAQWSHRRLLVAGRAVDLAAVGRPRPGVGLAAVEGEGLLQHDGGDLALAGAGLVRVAEVVPDLVVDEVLAVGLQVIDLVDADVPAVEVEHHVRADRAGDLAEGLEAGGVAGVVDRVRGRQVEPQVRTLPGDPLEAGPAVRGPAAGVVQHGVDEGGELLRVDAGALLHLDAVGDQLPAGAAHLALGRDLLVLTGRVVRGQRGRGRLRGLLRLLLLAVLALGVGRAVLALRGGGVRGGGGGCLGVLAGDDGLHRPEGEDEHEQYGDAHADPSAEGLRGAGGGWHAPQTRSGCAGARHRPRGCAASHAAGGWSGSRTRCRPAAPRGARRPPGSRPRRPPRGSARTPAPTRPRRSRRPCRAGHRPCTAARAA